jgi:polyphosphate kinase 2
MPVSGGSAGYIQAVAKNSDPEPESDSAEPGAPIRLTRKQYETELARLQAELVAMQEWIRASGERLLVLFEGRDSAGKGGAIRRITYELNPRFCRVVALPAPTERERTQWYFQRYISELPSAGEIVLFDRSWYNRAGVEKVMGFCTQQEYEYFMRVCPLLERALVQDGIILVKYWLSISDEEQRRRFESRLHDPARRWKLSPMDLQAQAHWVDYAEAKDQMFAYTDTKENPWYVVDAENKKSARLNLVSHLLSLVPYQPVGQTQVVLPPRQDRAYVRPPIDSQTFVPVRYVVG